MLLLYFTRNEIIVYLNESKFAGRKCMQMNYSRTYACDYVCGLCIYYNIYVAATTLENLKTGCSLDNNNNTVPRQYQRIITLLSHLPSASLIRESYTRFVILLLNTYTYYTYIYADPAERFRFFH